MLCYEMIVWSQKILLVFAVPKCHVTPTAEESSMDNLSITNWRSMLTEPMKFLKNRRISCPLIEGPNHILRKNDNKQFSFLTTY